MKSIGLNDLLLLLHSAFIDELNEQLPQIKLELSIPIALPKWDSPEGLDHQGKVFFDVVMAPFSFSFAIYLDGGAEKVLGSVERLGEKVKSRAIKEAEKRQIPPLVFGAAKAFVLSELSNRRLEADKVVWFLVHIDGRVSALAIGKPSANLK